MGVTELLERRYGRAEGGGGLSAREEGERDHGGRAFHSLCIRPPSRGLCAPVFPCANSVTATSPGQAPLEHPPKRKLTTAKVYGASPALRASVFT